MSLRDWRKRHGFSSGGAACRSQRANSQCTREDKSDTSVKYFEALQSTLRPNLRRRFRSMATRRDASKRFATWSAALINLVAHEDEVLVPVCERGAMALRAYAMARSLLVSPLRRLRARRTRRLSKCWRKRWSGPKRYRFAARPQVAR